MFRLTGFCCLEQAVGPKEVFKLAELSFDGFHTQNQRNATIKTLSAKVNLSPPLQPNLRVLAL